MVVPTVGCEDGDGDSDNTDNDSDDDDVDVECDREANHNTSVCTVQDVSYGCVVGM